MSKNNTETAFPISGKDREELAVLSYPQKTEMAEMIRKFASVSTNGGKMLKKHKPQLVSEALMLQINGVPETGDKFTVFTKHGEKTVYFGYAANGSYFFFDKKPNVKKHTGGTCYTKFVKVGD